MQSFYRFLMTFRHELLGNEITIFAEHVFHDHSFPKMSSNYHELSNYLETHADYILDMSLFDEVWILFLEKNSLV